MGRGLLRAGSLSRSIAAAGDKRPRPDTHVIGTAIKPFEAANTATIESMQPPTIQQLLMDLSDSWSKSTGPTQLRNIFIPEYVQKSIHAAVLDASADLIMESTTPLWNLSMTWAIATTAVVKAIASPKFADLQQSPLITEHLASLARFMEQIRKEHLANHKRKAISAQLNVSAKQQYMLDPFELDDGGNDRSLTHHELIREYCIKHMSTMLDEGTPKGDYWESYTNLYNGQPIGSAIFRKNMHKEQQQQKREQYSADTQQALKDGAPAWLAQRSKATRDRMDELVMESTDVMHMSLTDKTKGHLQGLFLITPNQLEDMINWVHSKYSGSKQDQASSQASDRVNSSQPDSQTIQGTQSNSRTATGSTQDDKPDETRPQPQTPQQASPAVSVQASQASRSAESSTG